MIDYICGYTILISLSANSFLPLQLEKIKFIIQKFLDDNMPTKDIMRLPTD